MAIPEMRLLELGLVPLLAVILGLYALGLTLGLAVHEFGHALVAWLVGFPVLSIRIGHGPVLVSRQLGSVHLEWRLWPVGGGVRSRMDSSRRLASVAFLLGGLAANLAALAITTAAWALPREENFGALLIAVAQLPSVAASALPYTRRWRGIVQISDMLKVWRLLHKMPELP